MMPHLDKKSEQESPPRFIGIGAAAKALGVTRTHLWRCLVGERSSPGLLRRYAELKTQSQTSALMSEENPRFLPSNESGPPVGGVDPADANYSGDWGEVLAKVGLTAICIQMPSSPAHFASSVIVQQIGEELTKTGLGHLDSSQYQPKIRHFYYLATRRLSEGLEMLKDRLEQHQELAGSCIGFMDLDSRCWRIFYPSAQPL
jgi:hypothetical protein